MRTVSRGLPLLVAALAIAYPWLVPNYYLVYAGALTVMYAAMSTSWNLLGGFTGYVSLGHSAFFGLGAYGTGLLVVRLGVPWVVALLVSALLVTLFAVGVGIAAVRVRGASFVIVSIALVSMMNLVVQGWRSLTGGSTGLQVPSPFPDLHRGQTHVVFFYLFLALLGVALLSWWYVSRSRFGAGLRAIREDEDKAESLGVPTGAYKVAAFALSALFVALAGGLYAVWFGSLDPIFVFSILIGSYMVLMSLLGGVRHLFGPLLGALIVAPAGEYFLIALGETQIHLTATGLVLVLVVLFMPDGILARLVRKRTGPSIPDESADQRLQGVAR
ncbi:MULTISPECIES: branched-chain amino acid ABC transporter permease [unclassified Nonomuraea]|uniref:branched-chain amino acid ABC transporter permease n=1 Tax=unclassified Nonomuraea TaxID=2593643 RepID=UPI0035BF15A1